MREYQARFYENVGVKVPCVTRLQAGVLLFVVIVLRFKNPLIVKFKFLFN